MKIPENITTVAALQPDYMGFIFYSKSPRFAGNLNFEVIKNLPAEICPVGVFVNTPIDIILQTTHRYGLRTVQLHGNETPTSCKILQDNNLFVIKAISISDASDLDLANDYQSCCDYLLFDTKTPLRGGSGKQYDWNILQNYMGDRPFFLSGGIGSEDAERILSFVHPKLKAIDINSRFETEPGVKNTETLKTFLNAIRTNNQKI